MNRPLNLMALDLSGTHLIEASAGTGKTYTIASLFLRLLLERRVPVESILVVTYTVPATDELKTRIRDKVRQARDAFVQGASDDEFIAWLMERVASGAQAVGILDDALARFDETAISTIHGFCQRMLKEMAFETASPFETELVADQADLVASIADDFYRMRIAAGTVPEFISFARSRKVSPEWFMELAGQRNLSAAVIPEGGGSERAGDLELLPAAYRQAFAGLKEAWPDARAEVELLLCDPDVIKQNILKITRMPGYLEAVDQYLALGPAMLPDTGCLARFTPEAVMKATKKGGKTPEHPVFDLCRAVVEAAAELMAAMEGLVTGLKVDFLGYLDRALALRKDKQGVVHFDDLLLRMHRALGSRGGEALAEAVRARFASALIDEFQDTDPLQYEIFRRCFARSTLFFIGDPKQAVYSFRGADVFTYAKAAAAVAEANTHTLLHNWRSTPGLIEAVNTMFSGVTDPFVFDWIRFEPAEPAPKKDRKDLAGLDEGPLMIWFLQAGDGARLTVEQAKRAVCRAVAHEISRLLNLSGTGAMRLGSDALKPRDMAVLVRTNTQARMVRDTLHDAHIPCVLYSDENVFGSLEALEMEMLLSALAEPMREGLVRTALMTRIFGLDPSDVDTLGRDEAAWEGWVERFRTRHETWARSGFTPVIRRILDGEHVRERLLERDGGERTLTNVLHIAELLGRAEAAGKLGMQGLRKWLAERRDPEFPGSDEYQLRLESDDDAVRVMTVHKSKGLEFPVVFCPFAWGAPKEEKGEGVLFHDHARNAVLDLGSAEQDDHRRQAGLEELAENVRLLYVALTRARDRCYVAWGEVNRAEQSAMAHLLKHLGEKDLRAGLEEFLARHTPHASVSDLPEGPPEPPRGADTSPDEPAERAFSRIVDHTWGMASYTSFIRGLHAAGDAADRDVLRSGVMDRAEGKMERAGDIFSFPRGARAGTLLHEVFERLDFAAGEADIRAVVEEALAAHGFDLSWTGAVTGMVRRVLDVDLGGFSLAGVPGTSRLTELEFMYPIRNITPEILAGAIDGCMQGGMPLPAPRFSFDPVKGFLRGFMDLVFRHDGKYYLVDWKSNHLGDSVEDYHQDALLNAMVRDGYVLQYHLYCVALHRYLRRRLDRYDYDEHFGGVLYVFLRGVDPGKGMEYGMFRARPEQEVIKELEDMIVDGGCE